MQIKWRRTKSHIRFNHFQLGVSAAEAAELGDFGEIEKQRQLTSEQSGG